MVSFDDGIDPDPDEEKSSFKRVSVADVFSNPLSRNVIFGASVFHTMPSHCLPRMVEPEKACLQCNCQRTLR